MSKVCGRNFMVVIMIVLFGFLASACGVYKGEISNNNIEGFESTGLSFFVNKTAVYKDEVLGAVNEAISDLGHDKIAELIDYHNKKLKGEECSLSFDIPDTSTLGGGY